MALRKLSLLFLGGGLLLGAASSCGSDDDTSAAQGFGGFGGTAAAGGGPVDAGRDRYDTTVDVEQPDAAPDAGPLNPLCGVGSCNPDSPTACAEFDAGAGDASTGVGGTGAGGSTSDASLDGPDGLDDGGADADTQRLPPPELRIDAGYTATPSNGSAADSGISPEDEPLAAFACRIRREGTERVRECAVSGSGGVDAPCVSSADCQPGLACVGENSTGHCRPLCCSAADACGTGNYCAERPLRDDVVQGNTTEPMKVPVCVKADDCSLAEPYPCPVDRDCKCQDLACMLVASDGTTSCIEPGTGAAGESCPCAWGHVCSQSTGTCLKLCATTAVNAECGSMGRCLAAAQLPVGWGVCVGPNVSDAG